MKQFIIISLSSFFSGIIFMTVLVVCLEKLLYKRYINLIKKAREEICKDMEIITINLDEKLKEEED